MKALLCLVVSATTLLAQGVAVGDKVTDFQLVDLSGKPVTLKSANGITAVIFVATECPVSNAYNERMNVLYKEYTAKGVHFVFVNSNRTEPAEEVRAHLTEHKLSYPVYKDPDNRLADRLNAQVTPEVYLVDAAGTLRYHGSIDDARVETKVQDLRARKALDALLAGKPVPAAETKAFGCTIRRVNKTS
ncbi:MAG: redoxin domain-containing protein [Bryobacteraceae bacterium]